MQVLTLKQTISGGSVSHLFTFLYVKPCHIVPLYAAKLAEHSSLGIARQYLNDELVLISQYTLPPLSVDDDDLSPSSLSLEQDIVNAIASARLAVSTNFEGFILIVWSPVVFICGIANKVFAQRCS